MQKLTKIYKNHIETYKDWIETFKNIRKYSTNFYLYAHLIESLITLIKRIFFVGHKDAKARRKLTTDSTDDTDL